MIGYVGYMGYLAGIIVVPVRQRVILPPAPPSEAFNRLKGNRRWLFQEAAFPRHPFRGAPGSRAFE